MKENNKIPTRLFNKNITEKTFEIHEKATQYTDHPRKIIKKRLYLVVASD